MEGGKTNSPVENVVMERLQAMESKLDALNKIVSQCKKADCPHKKAIPEMEKYIGAMITLVENSGDVIIEDKRD